MRHPRLRSEELRLIPFIRDRADLDIAARTGWAEARGDPPADDAAVVWTMRTRAEHPSGRYGRTLAEVCRKPRAYSCWAEGDPNLPKLHALAVGNPGYLRFLGIVVGVALGEIPDPTGGATHYHAASLERLPFWARPRPGLTSVRLGGHIFYRGVDP